EVAGAVRVAGVARALAAPDLGFLAARELQLLGDRAQHHDAPERRRERRDQDAVVAARDDARHGARRVAAETVGDEPLARDERLGIARIGGRPLDAANGFNHDVLWLRRCGGARAAADGVNASVRGAGRAPIRPQSTSSPPRTWG